MEQIAATLVLQPFSVVRATAPGVSQLVQPRAEWVDVSAFEQLTLYVHATRVAHARLTLQTSVAEDGDNFVALPGAAWTSPVTDVISVPPSASPGLMRWLRWHVRTTSLSAWVEFEMRVLLRGTRREGR